MSPLLLPLSDILLSDRRTVTHFLSHTSTFHASKGRVSSSLKLDSCFQVEASGGLSKCSVISLTEEEAFTYWCWENAGSILLDSLQLTATVPSLCNRTEGVTVWHPSYLLQTAQVFRARFKLIILNRHSSQTRRAAFMHGTPILRLRVLKIYLDFFVPPVIIIAQDCFR